MSDGSGASSTRRCSNAASFEDLPGKGQAAVAAAEQNRPKLRSICGG
jgi:hypothetical protein